MTHWLTSAKDPLPETHTALPCGSQAPGLLAAGEDLSTTRLIEAYHKGVFPWYSPGQPVLWWSPDPRMVLHTAEFKLSRSLRKTVRQFSQRMHCEIRIDSAFERVIQACANAPRAGQGGTWIVPEMQAAYIEWHLLGSAHSIETWIDGQLVGGLYGINLGHMFFGESMFALQTDASKIAVTALVCFCRHHGIDLIDCQQHTGHLGSLGAREISRSAFEAALVHRLKLPAVTPWRFDPAMWEHTDPSSAP
jgi:leucyl/phenylalanyl-tRNA---protein transferase